MIDNEDAYWKANQMVGEVKEHPKWDEIVYRSANGENDYHLSKEAVNYLFEDINSNVKMKLCHMLHLELENAEIEIEA